MDKIRGAVEGQQNNLQEVMQLPILRQQFLQGVKNLITEKSLQTNDKFDWKFALEGQRDCLECIAYHSLDDAFEIAGNDKNLLLRLLHSERVYARYFDQVDSIIAGFHAMNMYNNPHAGFLYVERRKRRELKGQTQSPNQIRSIFEQYDQGSLYEKMVRYYAVYLKQKKLDGAHMSYPGSDQEYNLEMLIDQMVKTDKRNLTGVRTSLEMMMNNQEYRDEQGNPVLITHGETALEKAKQYLHEKIIADLPKDCELKETEKGWKVAYPEGEEHDERYSGLRFQEVGQMCFGIGDGYSTFEKVGKNIFKVLEQSTGKNDWVDGNFQYCFDKSYKNVKVFNNNMFAVQSKKTGMWSLVEMPDDDYEKKIWKKKYYDIEVLDENSYLVKKEVDGKRWLVDRNEKRIFNQSYHRIQKVDDDRFIVKSAELSNMNLINRNEKNLFNNCYGSIECYDKNRFVVKKMNLNRWQFFYRHYSLK